MVGSFELLTTLTRPNAERTSGACALIEARERNLAGKLTSEFGPEPPPLTEALTYGDMTTSPDGDEFQVEDRLSEIRARYGSGHMVTRVIQPHHHN